MYNSSSSISCWFFGSIYVFWASRWVSLDVCTRMSDVYFSLRLPRGNARWKNEEKKIHWILDFPHKRPPVQRSTLLNPYWHILENSSRIFSEMSISGAWAGPISAKFIHQFFVSTYSVFVKYRIKSYFLKLRPYLDDFSRNRSSSLPEIQIIWNKTE